MGLGLGRARRLRWRLTLSYALVTIVTVLAVEVAFLALVQSWMFGSADFAAVVGGALGDVTSEAAPYLAQSPPDAAGLQSWLVGRVRGKYLRLPFDVDVADGPNAILVVVDSDGRTVATGNPARAKAGDNLAPLLPPEGRSALEAALAGDPNVSHRAVRGANGTVVVAVPIAEGGRTLGALVVVPDLAAMRGEFLGRAAGGVLASAIALTLFFGLLGTLFGYAWARWLTGRLRVLTDAVEAWGRGELDVVARDASPDELGEHARQLNRMAEELRALLQSRQALAVVEERQRLARELHDAVKQQVFAASMQIGAARALLERDPTAVREHLGEAEALIHQAQGELNALIRELRPAGLGEQGLAAALEARVRDWSRQTGIQAEVRATGDGELSPELEQALFRVAQEALANVARHSGASRIEVKMLREGDTLTLAIADDGHGFDVGRANGKGLGLTSMRERIEALGGTLRIESTSRGSRLEARIGLPSRVSPGGVFSTLRVENRTSSDTLEVHHG